jgi:hypothetical protein
MCLTPASCIDPTQRNDKTRSHTAGNRAPEESQASTQQNNTETDQQMHTKDWPSDCVGKVTMQ